MVKSQHKYLTERKQIEENKTFGILKMQNDCAELKIRAERKAGEFISQIPKKNGARPDVWAWFKQLIVNIIVDDIRSGGRMLVELNRLLRMQSQSHEYRPKK